MLTRHLVDKKEYSGRASSSEQQRLHRQTENVAEGRERKLGGLFLFNTSFTSDGEYSAGQVLQLVHKYQ